MKNIIKMSALLASIICILVLSVFPALAAQGTEGDELQVAEPSQLEIQLGPEWSGIEFSLRTDAGIYPNYIPVGNDGVLRLEIGGSSTYILSCLQTGTVRTEEEQMYDGEASETVGQKSETEANFRGIPIKHIVFFVIGILLAGGILVGFKIFGNKNVSYVEDEDEEDEE